MSDTAIDFPDENPHPRARKLGIPPSVFYQETPEDRAAAEAERRSKSPKPPAESLTKKISRWFSGDVGVPDAIKKLREVHAENEREKKWLTDLFGKATALRNAAQGALFSVSHDPNDATVAAAFTALRAARDVDIYDEITAAIGRNSADTIWRRKVERSTPACLVALDAIIARLNHERETEVARLKEGAAKYGSEVKTLTSPALEQIDLGI